MTQIVERCEIYISKEEKTKLNELAKRARETPVIQMMGRSLTGDAWERVGDYMNELADKYDVETTKDDLIMAIDDTEIVYVQTP